MNFLGKVHFQYLVTLCDDAEQNCPRVFWPGVKQHLHWSFEDPAAFEGPEDEKLDQFRKGHNQIRVKILSWLYEVAEFYRANRNVINRVFFSFFLKCFFLRFKKLLYGIFNL